MMKYFLGLKYLAYVGIVPAPGPPWTTNTGLPFGFPYKNKQLYECVKLLKNQLLNGLIIGYNAVLLIFIG